MTPLQREALQMCLEYIETDAHERRHVRWKIQEALAEPATEEFSAVQPAAQPQQEPVDFVSLLREAEEIVQGKPTWNRFIAATPLDNDIAVWMTVFAQDVARRDAPLPSQRKPLTDGEIENIAAQTLFPIDFARAIEAAHNIKENT